MQREKITAVPHNTVQSRLVGLLLKSPDLSNTTQGELISQSLI